MDWADSDVMYGVPAPDDHEMNDGRKVKLWMRVDDGERTFQHHYDYGNGRCHRFRGPAGTREQTPGWYCILVLEALAPMRPGVSYPRITEGRLARPPEDVGGPWGNGEFVEAIADPEARTPQGTSNGPAATSTRPRLVLGMFSEMIMCAWGRIQTTPAASST